MKTPEQVRSELDQIGKPLKQWCREHQINYSSAVKLLSGKVKGRWGHAHRAAVLLGIKHGRVVSVREFRRAEPSVRAAGVSL